MKNPQQSLKDWTAQKWRTKSGKRSSDTGERYLPTAAIKSLSSAEYAATTRAKRAGKKAGKQFVAQQKGIAKKFPELLERPLSFDDLMDIAESKLKEHVVYGRVLHDKVRLKNNFKIMDLGKPLVDEVEKQYLEELSEELPPALNTKAFMLLYNEDGLGRLMKDPELTINNTFKVINSFRK